MPELPEVEFIRHQIHTLALGKEIIRVISMNDTKVFPQIDLNIQKSLLGKKITGTGRKGKYLYFNVGNNSDSVVIHFGMTGNIVFNYLSDSYKGKLVEIEHNDTLILGKNNSIELFPRFTKLVLFFADNTQMAYLNSRRLGKIYYVEGDPEKQKPLSLLGPDVFLHPYSKSDWLVKLKGSGPVKPKLMDQNFISGIGNWMADEILYMAKVKPERRISTLTDSEKELILNSIFQVCTIACESLKNGGKYPESWIIHYRWTKVDPSTVVEKSSKKTKKVSKSNDNEGETATESESTTSVQKLKTARTVRSSAEIYTSGVLSESSIQPPPLKKIKLAGRPTFFAPSVQK